MHFRWAIPALRAILAFLVVCCQIPLQADTTIWIWDDFNGTYKSGTNGFIEEDFKAGDMFATHYYTGDSVNCLVPHTGTDQAQSFQYYSYSNDNNFVTYIETRSLTDPEGHVVDLLKLMALRGQDPIDLTQPITYRVRVYGHNDAVDPDDPNAYWRQVFSVREPEVASDEILWTSANNDTWQTLEVTQTGLDGGRRQWLTFESWYPEFYGSMISDTSYMNWENLEIEYTPIPPDVDNVIVVADTTDFPGYFHVENESRTFGLRCRSVPGMTVVPQRGDLVTLWGDYISTSPEKVLLPNTVKIVSSGNPIPRPLTMVQRGVGGQPYVPAAYGPNTVGILARICGKVTYLGSGFFYIDDGSSLPYASGVGTTGIKVYGPTTGVAFNRYVTVTGVIGAETASPTNAPVIRARNAADITLLP